MKPASISELKKELQALPPKELMELCLRLARFKKENKELLNYILFEADDEQSYLESIKIEVNDGFWNLQRGSMYLVKKGLRKILKAISKYSKLSPVKETELELLLHFCKNLNESGIRYRNNKALLNLYNQQLKKLDLLIGKVHEDLAFDYKKRLEELL